MNDTYVIKLSGALISKSKDEFVNFSYLQEFKKVITKYIDQGKRFVIIVGGGFASRYYRDSLINQGINNTNNLHWVGTTVCVLHAEIAKSFFADLADPDVIKFEDYYQNDKININGFVKFGGGGRPGHSGDFDAFLVAKKLNIESVICLKNIDAVYDSDPKTNADAKKIKTLSWDKYFKIIGNVKTHSPSANFPIDPVTAQSAKELNKKYIILPGNNLPNLENYLQNNDFLGSVVGENE